MELRKHPFMSFDGISKWPPKWIWTFGTVNGNPLGEVGVLEAIQQSSIDPNVCFLTMSHNGGSYVGRLEFEQQDFCQQLCELLAHHCGRSLNEIAALDIPSVPSSPSRN
jgi:hypothetical protein